MHGMHDEMMGKDDDQELDDTKSPSKLKEKSAADQLSGELGEIDKLIMLLLEMKKASPPSPFAAPLGSPPMSPPSPAPMPAGMPMGAMTPPPPGMGAGGPPPMMPQMMNQMQASGGLM